MAIQRSEAPQQGEMNAPSLYNPYVQPSETRVLGLDVGLRRIGVAISDPLGMTAQGLDTLHRKNKKHVSISQ